MIIGRFLCVEHCNEMQEGMTFPMDSPEDKTAQLNLEFSSSNGICWLRDSAGILVFNSDRHKYWLLAGLEADLWSWIVLGCSLKQMIRYVARSMDLEDEIASQKIFDFFRYLIREEILRISLEPWPT